MKPARPLERQDCQVGLPDEFCTGRWLVQNKLIEVKTELHVKVTRLTGQVQELGSLRKRLQRQENKRHKPGRDDQLNRTMNELKKAVDALNTVKAEDDQYKKANATLIPHALEVQLRKRTLNRLESNIQDLDEESGAKTRRMCKIIMSAIRYLTLDPSLTWPKARHLARNKHGSRWSS
jgi:myosin heavy subunit